MTFQLTNYSGNTGGTLSYHFLYLAFNNITKGGQSHNFKVFLFRFSQEGFFLKKSIKLYVILGKPFENSHHFWSFAVEICHFNLEVILRCSNTTECGFKWLLNVHELFPGLILE